MTGDLALAAVIAVVMVIGLAGTLLPLLPGLWLIWAAGLVYTLVEARDGAGLVFMGVSCSKGCRPRPDLTRRRPFSGKLASRSSRFPGETGGV